MDHEQLSKSKIVRQNHYRLLTPQFFTSIFYECVNYFHQVLINNVIKKIKKVLINNIYQNKEKKS